MKTFAKQTEIYLVWLTTRKRAPLKATSLATIQSLTRAAMPVLGRMRLEDVDNGALKNLAAILDKETYSPKSIQSILTVVKKVVASDKDKNGKLRHVRDWDEDFIDAPQVESEEVHPPTKDFLENALMASRSPIWQFIATQAATGARKGELCALNVADFDATNDVLHISRTLSRYGETSTKTRAGRRQVDIHPDITAMLVAMLDGRAAGRLFDISVDAVRWGFDKLGLRSHGLRHFRYTHLQHFQLPSGIHDYWIGHSQKSLEKVYGHIHEHAEPRHSLAREIGYGFTLPAVATVEQHEHAEVVSA
jgi:integrase